MDSDKQIEHMCFQVEQLSKTSLELGKCYLISKSSNVISSLVVFMSIFMMILFSILFVSMALADWIGQFFGGLYVGLMLVSLLYVFLTLLIFMIKRRGIQKPFRNYLIRLFQQE